MKYKKIVHYSKCKRSNGHPGGVEKFAWYLQKAINCEVLIPEDKPVLNDPETLYIVDNHWGLKIADGCRVICMLHGCAGEKNFNYDIGNQQKKMVSRPNTYFVANSQETADLCRHYYGSKIDEVIYLAVDDAMYYPRHKTSKKTVLTTTAGKAHKGHNVMSKIKQSYSKHFTLVDMKCGLDEEVNYFKQADLFVLLSSHEGFAYSVLEAMCANLPVLTGKHGIAYELHGKDIIHTLSDNELGKVNVVADNIMKILSSKDPVKTRQWVLNNCSLDMFNKKWQELIRRELND